MTYMDFADDDKKAFDTLYKTGTIANVMAAMAQNACEKYLKHIIETDYKEKDEPKTENYIKTMRSHSLIKLLQYIDQNIMEIPDNITDNILKAEGYYFTTRYPGEDSISVTQKEINRCKTALDVCCEYTHKFVLEKEMLLEKASEEKKESPIFEESIETQIQRAEKEMTQSNHEEISIIKTESLHNIIRNDDNNLIER